ncbi:ruvB-like helicase 1 [Chenopodium quinoa]|uniref:ruvB-like helicase 1 n=1 Tax=Chenopodium quinoa TaxID=63459 RepID=UPI000B7932D0|nr:ruvB-like helicase 1 [Chenopodium quinoa]
MVSVPKKDGRVRLCVDYRDLNMVSPKDDFPLPHIDISVDNTANHALLSFIDGYAGYNKILMAKQDMEKTTFLMPWGTYCYTLIPFGLKNAGFSILQLARSSLVNPAFLFAKEIKSNQIEFRQSKQLKRSIEAHLTFSIEAASEVTKLSLEETESVTADHGESISHVTFGLRTRSGTKQLKLDPNIYFALIKEKVLMEWRSMEPMATSLTNS